MSRRRITAPREAAGFTLLEVLLALALSVVIVGAISMAVRLHLINLQKQSRRIEYKQVARSVLTMIANDLRNGVQYKPIDYSVLEELVASQAAQTGVPTTPEEGTGDPGGAGDSGGNGDRSGTDGAGSTGDGSGAGDDEETESLALPEEEVEGRPTLIGTQSAISIDVSRIPRLDEYSTFTQSETRQLPSDIKTVLYFAEEAENSANEPQFVVISNAAPGGLYRRQIDRSVAAFRDEDSITDDLDEFAELIAPEIAQIAFRYFDGEEWLDSWDSLQQGGFPPAVEVNVVIDPARMESGSSYRYNGFDPETMERFRMVISLPTGEPVAEDE